MRIAAVLMVFSAASRLVHPVSAAAPDFPYQAAVVVEEVLVRSGGGEKTFYPTQRLTRDAVVTVRRHDPGGWYVIEPPEGSFSWISAGYVERRTNNQGMVKEDDAVVFVGSEFGDEASVWQRRLGRGDVVEILDVRELETLSGPRTMYRIMPPQREWRWIPGSAVVALDEAQRAQQDQDPFDVPSSVLLQPSSSEPSSFPAAPPSAVPAPSERLARIQTIRGEQRQLAEIDRRFREMLQEPMSQWDLDSIESDYSSLQRSAIHQPIVGHIDLRYPAIERYRERVAQFRDFERLTTETERRDAQLVASAQGAAGFGIPDVPPGSTGAVASGDAVAADDSPALFDEPLQLPASGNGFDENAGPDLSWGPEDDILTPQARTPASDPQNDPFFVPRSNASYIGAGIIRKSPSGEFVLTTPAGRELAKLGQTEGVSLDEFVGQQVGLHGKRWYRQELQSDFIEVTGLEPVRIRR